MSAPPKSTDHHPPRPDVREAVQELITTPGSLPLLWGRRGFWQIKLRWAVAPLMILGVLVGRGLGFTFSPTPFLIVAVATFLYNNVFAWVFVRYEQRLLRDRRFDRIVTILQVALDYVAMFVLLHLTGGSGSPLAIFLIFHVIIASIQFRAKIAYLLAASAGLGPWLLLLGETTGWVPSPVILWHEQPFHVLDRPEYTVGMLSFLTAALFITVSMVSRIMRRLRSGFTEVARTTSELSLLNDKMRGLYEMVRAIGAERRVDPILQIVTSELATVLGIPAVAVTLLDEDDRTLHYVATYGLPETFRQEAVIPLDSSSLSRRILDGETLVHDHFQGSEAFELQPELRDLGFRSAALAPLRVEDGVIGTLGVYSLEPNRFDPADAEFLELAAELAAIGIADARTNEEVERLMRERTEFMLEVAHNLRAPLGASLSMLELVSDDSLGSINESQSDYLNRISLRLRSLHRLIGDLLTIGQTRDMSREIPDVVVDLHDLAQRTERMFEDEARSKTLTFTVENEPDLPFVDSGADLLDQILENLVSNAIKYTPEQGEVAVRFERAGPDSIRISVRDTGIGIPDTEKTKLFREFFRASNAKEHTREGTGLGLALVKQAVERHGGRVDLQSQEDEGTTVVVEIPVRQPGTAVS